MWYDNYYRQFYTKLNKNGPKHGQVTFCNNSHLGGTRQKLPVGICLATIAQYKFPIDIDNDTRGNNDLYDFVVYLFCRKHVAVKSCQHCCLVITCSEPV